MASTGENCAVNIGSLVSARRFRCERPAGLNAAGDPTRLLRLSEVTSLCVPPAFVHRITKYDPADPDEHGSYRGAEEAVSDHEPVEAGYLEPISALAEAAGIDRLEIRELSVAGSSTSVLSRRSRGTVSAGSSRLTSPATMRGRRSPWRWPWS
ncbi:hypothetical protein ACWDWS_33220 [Streptomyces sp. NPDC003328]